MVLMQHPQVLSALAYFAISFAAISSFFSDSTSKSKKRSLFMCAAVLTCLAAVKMGFDVQSLSPSYYSVLEVGRSASVLEIRKAYKRLSKIHHPDKNLDSPNAEERFQGIKSAYDILMDETQRDIYNRFGPNHLEFDPRKDEMKLISDVMVVYLFWIVTGYIMTLPLGARASRTWMTILGILLMATEVCFRLTEMALPQWFPGGVSEYQLIFYLHSSFPFIIALLRAISESLYVDADAVSMAVLKEVYKQQKALNDMLEQLQSLVEMEKDLGTTPSTSNDASELMNIQDKITELRDYVDDSSDNTTHFIEQLKNCSSNPGANYYWLIFVAMYGGIYFLQ